MSATLLSYCLSVRRRNGTTMPALEPQFGAVAALPAAPLPGPCWAPIPVPGAAPGVVLARDSAALPDMSGLDPAPRHPDAAALGSEIRPEHPDAFSANAAHTTSKRRPFVRVPLLTDPILC